MSTAFARSRRTTSLFGVATLVIALGPVPAAARQASMAASSVPTPASVLGFEPGTDKRLPTWSQVQDYYTRLDEASPRVSLRVVGKTTLGRPFLAVFFSDSANIANLPRYQEIQRKLADPRLRAEGERARLIADGKVVILVTSSIHSTEVGGHLTPFRLADRLARGNDPETLDILRNTIIILVPSQNPDGMDIVGDWYRSTLGTPTEGAGPPVLYNYYAGHDNNRDWYAFNLPETRATVDSLYAQWFPQINNDIHQQGGNSGRIFIPPYMDPIEPNIDPILTAETNALGMAMVWRMLADGKTGVASNASYDQWSPARQYQLNHGGARILTETASAALASPVDVPFERLGRGRGYDAKVVSWNYPVLWMGGHWGIGDIVDYQTSASWALFAATARERARWLESYATVQDHSIQGNKLAGREAWPSAIVIPRSGQPDATALQTLLWTLQHGQVEIRETTAPVTVDGETFAAGSYVVPTAQPFGGYAKALLERQEYPHLLEYPGGPPKAPYDVTAHTLPLLFGVKVAAVSGPEPRSGPPMAEVPTPTFTAPGLSGRTDRRIALYKSYAASMDEGWTRLIFDNYKIPFTSAFDGDVRAGNLNARFDVVILPDQSTRGLRDGLGANYPDSLRGGLGSEGGAALRSFVENGGTLVAFNEATAYAIETLSLPVRNVLQGLPATDFYGPGSILSVNLAPGHPVTRGMKATPAIWFEDSPAFEVTDASRATVLATYPSAGDPLLSGWLLGGERLHGRAAAVDVSLGRGHVILFGFRPQYRAQTMATYPMIWGAILGR
ncbi:MAG TPA: M14 family metallopeptidase [Longimicrobiales bacterium]|nr:M14 family metallopeptidase [Longimicrobiales bacterium]